MSFLAVIGEAGAEYLAALPEGRCHDKAQRPAAVKWAPDEGCKSDRNCYLPTEAQIRQARDEIKACWDESTRQQRMASAYRMVSAELTPYAESVFGL